MGTSHGAYKFKPGTRPELRFDILEAIMDAVPGFPIVLHGASSVPQKYIEMVNRYGGKMPGAVGIPDEQLRRAAELAVCKINVASDTRIAITGTVRQYFCEHPERFDPRQYLKPARENIKELVRHKLRYVLGSAGKASNI
jgi:fructose-bisphosphate aldolase class II